MCVHTDFHCYKMRLPLVVYYSRSTDTVCHTVRYTDLHRFARNDYFCQNSPIILKTDQFPYISPLCRKSTVLHRFARNNYFCQNSSIILKTDQLPYISPLSMSKIYSSAPFCWKRLFLPEFSQNFEN